MKKTDNSQDCAVQYWWNQDLNISQQQTNALSFILKDVVSYLCYAQHSQRYLRQAPHTHKGTWKICGCLYNCTSAVHKTVCQKQDVQLHKQKSSHTLQNMSNCQLAKGWGVDKKNTTTKNLKQLYQRPIKTPNKKWPPREKGTLCPPHRPPMLGLPRVHTYTASLYLVPKQPAAMEQVRLISRVGKACTYYPLIALLYPPQRRRARFRDSPSWTSS